ncbi:transcription termination factor Rho [Lacrimispora celerecrescens]|uniref:Transcription termination factor Rho n=1 Tax=[Clostridium] celerecrescens 18A TaxID=1286362 RepID=A0A2M8Z8R9_9FIRM|nr:transcription termination factor Rho [Lacrimispora celerecrescens]PJJ29843.1 transcription termination factor Rho [[Clostridium] celerecrescens 18A]
MREKLQTLPLAELKELAKAQGIKGCSSMRKAEIIDLLCEKGEEAPAFPASPGNVSAEKAEGVKKEVFKTVTAQPAPQTQPHTDSVSQQGQMNGDQQMQSAAGSQRKTVVRSYRPEGQQRPASYRPAQGNSTEPSARNEARPETVPEEPRGDFQPSPELQELDSGIEAHGILEVMPDGFGFIRCENYLPGENDVYVAPSQIRRFNMKTGDIIHGSRRVKTAAEKFAALLYVKKINGYPTSAAERRPNFENMTPIFPDKRLHMETQGGKNTTAMRVLDLLAPIGKGQRGMIVSPPKAGKTTLLKDVAKAITVNHPEIHLMILLIDERPEEVTDIKESIYGNNVEVLYSTFDELPDRHKRVSEMVIERAKRLVEHGRDVVILLDSITRLARAYNLTVAPSGRTLSGGLDPAALHMPKRFFGAARNMREGGSLTVLATALVDTGSRMDDVIYEEFKGTGNMELVLDRKLSEKRIFPAIDILKSGTRRDDLLLTREEAETVDIVRKATNTLKPEDAVEKILDLFSRTRNNREFVETSKKMRFF